MLKIVYVYSPELVIYGTYCAGLENGDIYLNNLKFDETVVKFHQDWGSVTALTFRTDGGLCCVDYLFVGRSRYASGRESFFPVYRSRSRLEPPLLGWSWIRIFCWPELAAPAASFWQAK